LTSISLAWEDASNNETGFNIYRSVQSNTGYIRRGQVGANVTSYVDTGLSTGTDYYYQVSAYNGAGETIRVGPVRGTTGFRKYLPLLVR
jgi:fibronectin type 3 domain-containing protein